MIRAGRRDPAGVWCIGHAVQDFVFAVETLPSRGTKYRARGFRAIGGGPAANAAVAIARLGGRAMLSARLGEDAAAGLVIDELEAHGVDCDGVRRFAGAATSVSAVMVDTAGERMIVNHLDPALPREPDWLPKTLPGGIRAVLGDSRWSSGAAHGFAVARAAGIPAVLDGDIGLPQETKALGLATHLAFSAAGLAEFTGETEPRSGLLVLRRRFPAAWCCVTLGEAGVLIATERGLDHAPGMTVDAVDTLGAGDVWHGAFALALAEGADEIAAVRFANATAALKVQNADGRAGFPTRETVEATLKGRVT
jgi:sulfofructose kinase